MQVTIEKLVYGGAGLARTDQGVIFVPRTAPGDVAEIEIIGRKKDYATGRLRELITPSPDRQTPDCPNYETVGCCHWQHIRYDRQLDFKEAILRESLSRLARLEFNEPIARISGPDRGYRLRATFHVRHGKLGFVREHTNTVVPITECAALSPELNAFIAIGNRCAPRVEEVHAVACANGVAASIPYEGQPESPFIEVGAIRYGIQPDTFFQANRFLLGDFVDEVIRQGTEPPAASRLSPMKGEHSDAVPLLRGTAASEATRRGVPRVLELFSGSGFFSIPLAKVSEQLIGVENHRAAVKQARDNARMNGVWNTRFALGAVDTTLQDADLQPDLVVLNPPRTGAGPEVAARIAGLKAPRVVYVSCNPTTFAREAVVLVKNGYRLTRVTMIDQFPNTYHIELVATLER
jgi:23S rRNA (uracil1939-C5)-methyltransferase